MIKYTSDTMEFVYRQTRRQIARGQGRDQGQNSEIIDDGSRVPITSPPW